MGLRILTLQAETQVEPAAVTPPEHAFPTEVEPVELVAPQPPGWLLRAVLGLALLGLTGMAAFAYLHVWAGQLVPAGLMTLLWLGVAWWGAAKLRAGWPWFVVGLLAALVLLVVPVALLVVLALLRG